MAKKIILRNQGYKNAEKGSKIMKSSRILREKLGILFIILIFTTTKNSNKITGILVIKYRRPGVNRTLKPSKPLDNDVSREIYRQKAEENQ